MKLRISALVALVALVGACGGGGGGGGGTPPPTPPSASLTFTPASTTTINSITLTRINAGASELLLEVRANSVQGLYGLAFDLSFPSNVLRFDEAVEGDFLAGAQTSMLVEETPAGNLVAGVTRLGNAAGVTGSGALMTLRFTAIGSGGGDLVFGDREAFDRQGLGLAGVAWGGGSVQVQL